MIGVEASEALGKQLDDIYHCVDENKNQPTENALTRAMQSRSPIEHVEMARSLQSQHGRRYMIDESATPVLDSDGNIVGGVLVFRDISEQRLLAEELSYRATHDPLTGLANRSEFERQLKNLIGDARKNGTHHAMLFIDLDQFKVINDAGGHVAGDEVLRLAGETIRKSLRKSDMLARVSGDEFAALLPECDTSQAERTASTVIDALSAQRIKWHDRVFRVSASIGIAGISADTEGVAQIMSSADAACYTAKDKGRNRYYVTTAKEVIARQDGELSMMAEINRALDENRLILAAENVVETESPNQVVYREVLSRLRGDDGAIMSPGAFIPVAERYFMSAGIDRHVTNLMLKLLTTTLKDDGHIYAINLSGQMIGDQNMLSFIESRLDHYEMDASRLCIEMTETAAIAHLPEAMRFMRKLKERGCRFAMDDFGSGMASFGYLKTLPFDFIKIDGSFVRDLVAGGLDRTLVEAVARIGKDLNITTIAEQVEDKATLDILREIGVDCYQGWINGKGEMLAMPPDGS